MSPQLQSIVPRDSALLLVDIQPDFMPGGALPVPEGDRIVSGVRALMESDLFALQVATQDWHPPGHISFASVHPGREPMDTMELYGHPQTLWPDHCVQGTAGAALHPDLPWRRMAAIIRKGAEPDTDSYSALRNNWNPDGRRPPTGLGGYLRERGVTDLFVCGLARDVCVKWTVEDAARAGFRVRLLWDLTRPVDPASDSQVRSGLQELGVEIVDTERIAG